MRVFAMIVVLLLCLPVCASAELLAVTTDDLAVLLETDGTERIGVNEWNAIYELVPDTLYAAGMDTRSGREYYLCDARGSVLSSGGCDMLSITGEYVLFRRGSRIGIMDIGGNVLLAPSLTDARATDDGALLVLTGLLTDGEPNELFRLEADMSVTKTGIFVLGGLNDFSEGAMPYTDAQTGLMGYLGADGQPLLEARYDWCGEFSGGLATACEDGKCGILRSDGSWAVSPEFDRIDRSGGLFCGILTDAESTTVCLMDSTGTRLPERSGVALSARMLGETLCVTEDGISTLYGSDGSILFETDGLLLQGADGIIVCRDEDSEELLLSDGTITAKSELRLLPLDAYCAAVYDDSGARPHAGLMTISGEILLDAVYTDVRRVGEKRYFASGEMGSVLVDETGKILWQLEVNG